VTCGTRHIKFWKLKGRNLFYKDGKIGKRDWNAIGAMTYACENKYLVTGDNKGCCGVWYESELLKKFKCHENIPITIVVENKGRLFTCGKDGTMHQWDMNDNEIVKYKKGDVLDIKEISNTDPAIISLDFK
jgi:WD40 repeat protein